MVSNGLPIAFLYYFNIILLKTNKDKIIQCEEQSGKAKENGS